MTSKTKESTIKPKVMSKIKEPSNLEQTMIKSQKELLLWDGGSIF